mmetsp:Transcript_19858/g.38921  ORF Transcript_19858/g.38921 Transcript_19858/m.38921 type:complete len:344 (+) Transcript_19858:583-1614(+)|eukprot:CAMPEP_0171545084 /NCGR_PEP_ID=MMETSP0960-20121227/3869_1 /TAXON_ID=87120 /ORGANISM="Aurantiochytrium limacinum, Strain ATCCMYA-1381" /LENGTH=343 /DNA_ID=CAMNT_0012092983 /DNA_START=559 /DNA_END=1590 /DNA_ORIENTATION=+
MGVAGDSEQATDTAGYLFGVIFAPILWVFCLSWAIYAGRKGNDYYCYAPQFTWARGIPVLVWRVAIAVFYVVTLGYEFDARDVWELQYYTVWNLVFLTLYSLFALAVSIVIVATPHLIPKPATLATNKEAPTQPNMGIKMLWGVHQVLGEIEWCASALVAIVVWGVLAPNTTPEWSPYLGFTSISEHACNIFVMTVDFYFSGYLINFHHWSLSVLWPASYLIWHLGGNVAYGFMAYPFLKTNNILFIPVVIVLAVAHFVLFSVTYGLSVAKEKCLKRYHFLYQEDNDTLHRSQSERLRMSSEDSDSDSDDKSPFTRDIENPESPTSRKEAEERERRNHALAQA